ncbi:MAG: hypothetical protein KDA32_11220, partial [Phycisphaerales bacterium]|nr:hypothetical protein [Phycisphaerales bacterium]
MTQSITASDLRQFLLNAAQRRSPYDFLHNAFTYLDHVGSDDEVRMLAAQQFLAIGLTRCAREMIEACDQGEARERVEAVLEAIPTRDDEQAPLGAASPWFARNLSAAATRFPRVADHADSITSALRNLDVFVTNDEGANPLISRRVGEGPRRWLPSILNWKYAADNADVAPARGTLFVMPYALEGLGCGRLLERIWRATDRMFLTFGPRIHVVESNLAQLGVWLSLDDRTELLANERLLLWIGPSAANDYVVWRESNPNEQEPAFVIRQPGWGAAERSVMEQPLRAGQAARNGRRDALLARLRAHYNTPQQVERLAERFAAHRTRPLSILGVTSRFTTFLQYSMRDIAEAARAAGHEFHTLIEPNDYTPSIPGESIMAEALERKPDLIVMIDHNRAEFGDLYAFNAPFCNW